MYHWNEYNEKLIRRGEIFISKDVINSWNKELAVMNRNKIGRKYQFPDSFMKILGYVRVYFGLPALAMENGGLSSRSFLVSKECSEKRSDPRKDAI